MKKTTIIILSLLALSFILSIITYPYMPEQVVSHWNFEGQPDGYMSRFWGLFTMPLILIILTLLFLAIPKIDPLKHNIKKFRSYYDTFIIIFLVFMLSIHLFTILWNLNIKVPLNFIIPIATAGLFYYISILLKKAKRNWFIGIRTPWTLSSDKVWKKTHQLGSKLFKVASILILLGILFPTKYIIWFILAPLIAVTIYLVVYSYVIYKKK